MIASLPSSLKSPIAVVCHDAGASNLIFAWLRQWVDLGLLDQNEFHLFLRGPAEETWRLNPVSLPRMEMHIELASALATCQSVLTGTGWGSSLEHDARRHAAELQIISIAVIDHWVNYVSRFERDGVLALPDQIWVSDHYAAEMAQRLFSHIPVIELPNTYLQSLVKGLLPARKDCNELLYVLEPLRNNWGRNNLGEFQALDFFLENLEKIVGSQDAHIKLRPHPSEKADKYHAWKRSHANFDIELDANGSLNDAIAKARWVAGGETFAMVVAIAAGRETYSTLPPWAHKCRLPFKEIIHLRHLL